MPLSETHSKLKRFIYFSSVNIDFNNLFRIAILDEPSSGLDPESRRELWNILLEMRKNHTILITTHYMEEAETLADHISIMSRGEILCDGTAMELKRKYADGYVMKLLTTNAFDVAKLMALVQGHIPTASTKVRDE